METNNNPTPSTMRDRCIAFCEYRRLNKSEFARRIGASAAFVNGLRRHIRPDLASRIKLSFPDLNFEWLLTGRGEMLNENVELPPEPSLFTQQTGISPAEIAARKADAIELETLRKLVKYQQEQINQLMGIIQSMTKK